MRKISRLAARLVAAAVAISGGRGLTAFFGACALGMMTLRVAVNAVVAAFGISTFALLVRRQKDKAFPPKVGPSLHYEESDEQKGQAS